MQVRKVSAGATCTSSRMTRPHSRSETSAITSRASSDRRPVYPIMLYVEMRTHASLCSGSFLSAVKRVTRSLSSLPTS